MVEAGMAWPIDTMETCGREDGGSDGLGGKGGEGDGSGEVGLGQP